MSLQQNNLDIFCLKLLIPERLHCVKKRGILEKEKISKVFRMILVSEVDILKLPLFIEWQLFASI